MITGEKTTIETINIFDKLSDRLDKIYNDSCEVEYEIGVIRLDCKKLKGEIENANIPIWL